MCMHIIPTAILFVKIKVYLHALLHQIYLRINEYLKVKEVSKNSKKGTQKSRKRHIVQSKMLQPQLGTRQCICKQIQKNTSTLHLQNDQKSLCEEIGTFRNIST